MTTTETRLGRIVAGFRAQVARADLARAAGVAADYATAPGLYPHLRAKALAEFGRARAELRLWSFRAYCL